MYGTTSEVYFVEGQKLKCTANPNMPGYAKRCPMPAVRHGTRHQSRITTTPFRTSFGTRSTVDGQTIRENKIQKKKQLIWTFATRPPPPSRTPPFTEATAIQRTKQHPTQHRTPLAKKLIESSAPPRPVSRPVNHQDANNTAHRVQENSINGRPRPAPSHPIPSHPVPCPVNPPRRPGRVPRAGRARRTSAAPDPSRAPPSWG